MCAARESMNEIGTYNDEMMTWSEIIITYIKIL